MTLEKTSNSPYTIPMKRLLLGVLAVLSLCLGEARAQWVPASQNVYGIQGTTATLTFGPGGTLIVQDFNFGATTTTASLSASPVSYTIFSTATVPGGIFVNQHDRLTVRCVGSVAAGSSYHGFVIYANQGVLLSSGAATFGVAASTQAWMTQVTLTRVGLNQQIISPDQPCPAAQGATCYPNLAALGTGGGGTTNLTEANPISFNCGCGDASGAKGECSIAYTEIDYNPGH